MGGSGVYNTKEECLEVRASFGKDVDGREECRLWSDTLSQSTPLFHTRTHHMDNRSHVMLRYPLFFHAILTRHGCASGVGARLTVPQPYSVLLLR